MLSLNRKPSGALQAPSVTLFFASRKDRLVLDEGCPSGTYFAPWMTPSASLSASCYSQESIAWIEIDIALLKRNAALRAASVAQFSRCENSIAKIALKHLY